MCPIVLTNYDEGDCKIIHKRRQKGEEHIIPSVFKESILLEMGIWPVVKASNFENLKFPKQVRHSLFSDLVYFLKHKGAFVLGKGKR